MSEQAMANPVRAVLEEILLGLEHLLHKGEARTIYIDKMGLTPEERESIRDCLGTGGIRIRLEADGEPAEWIESGVSGVWYGVFFGQNGSPLLETIEIAFFPHVASAQREDIESGAARLRKNTDAAHHYQG